MVEIVEMSLSSGSSGLLAEHSGIVILLDAWPELALGDNCWSGASTWCY